MPTFKSLAGSVLLTLPALFLQAKELTDSLTLNGETIREVVITGQSPQRPHPPRSVSTTHLREEQLEQESKASLLPLLGEQTPGLFVTSRGAMGYGISSGSAGGITLRGVGGSPTTGILVVVDGEPQYMGLMGHPLADTHLSSRTDEVEVVRGPASLRYGSNAMGGVIHIHRREGEQRGLHGRLRSGYGSWQTLQNDLRLELGASPLRASLGGLYNRSNGHRPNMEFEQYGANLNLAVDLGSHWRVGGQAEMIHFNSSNPGSIASPLIDNDAEVTRLQASVRLSHRHEELSGGVTLFYNQGHHLINDGHAVAEEPTDYRYHSRDRLWGLTLREELSLPTKSLLTMGVDLFRFGGRAWNRILEDGHDEELIDKEEWEGALFTELQQGVGRRLTLDVGLRYDHHSAVGGVWIPHFGFSINTPRGGALRASVSKGFRFPTLRERFLFRSANPHLEPEEVVNYEVAWSQTTPRQRLRYGINLFYLEGKNLIQTRWIEGRPHNENSGRIENWGVEGEFVWQVAKALQLEGNYSYLHMRHPVLASPEHKAHLGVRLEVGRWRLQASGNYIHGLYTSLPTESEPAQRSSYLNLGVNTSLRVARWLTLWLRGENLLDRTYEINAGFPMPGITLTGGVEIVF